jgi:hypothetical protein
MHIIMYSNVYVWSMQQNAIEECWDQRCDIIIHFVDALQTSI